MTHPARAALLITLAAASGCGLRGEPDANVAPAVHPAAPVAAPDLADSLLLSAPGGVTVWLTEGRPSSSSEGAPCVERTLEIRRDTSRIKVPLLYTISTPTLLDDSTLRARLARACRPAEAYRVDLRSGRPTRIPDPSP